jgi:two-component system chemotaxis response regulator CheB
MSGSKRVRVLIVDDSAIARDLLERGLSMDPDLEVVGKAADAYVARDKIVFLKPDVVTLDVEMPRMDGIAFLRKLMPQYPIPVVVVSAVTAEGSRRALEALEAGALDVVAKPSAKDPAGLKTMISELAERVKEAAKADPEKLRVALVETAPATASDAAAVTDADAAPKTALKAAPKAALTSVPARPKAAPVLKSTKSSGSTGMPSRRVIAIGASTGGTIALAKVVTALPADSPPVVIVQHMPPVFTKMFAESMNRQSRVTVKEAEDGDALLIGRVLVAPGDRHMRLRKTANGYIVGLSDGAKVSGHRPSVDVLFTSVAEVAGNEAVASILTGMGRDGADGMLALRRAGARCVAQDEATSVVFGMPREAWDNGAAEVLVPIDRMAHEIMVRAGGSLMRGS